jgi:putative ABC transport system permease protein
MTRATLQGLLAHKLRLLMAALAIVLGVSFVTGTLVLGDTLNSTFDNLFNQVNAGVDVTVRSKTTVKGQFGEPDFHPPVSESVLNVVSGTPGVHEAFGQVQGRAVITARDGSAIHNGGAPTFGFLWNPYDDLSALHLRSGQPPHGDSEVVIDVKTATDNGFKVGDSINIAFATGQPRTYRISGITGFGTQDNLVGATIAALDPATGRTVLGEPNQYDLIEVRGDSGVVVDDLRARIAARLPQGLEAITGKTLTQEEIDQVGHSLGFLTTALLVFAGIALFVGSFIILNTFNILVAQRQRELALLRCLGASRAQVLRSVLLESFITGLIASAAGVGFGVLIAEGLQALLNAIGLSLSGTSLQFQARTPIVAVIVGTLITMGAALLPAVRATRVPPVAAMRESVPTPSAVSARRIVAGSAITGAGVALLLLGLFALSSRQLVAVGAGALLTFIGVAILAPVIAVPVVRVLGLPVKRLRGAAGTLARENAMRNPRRTATTASALMIGIGLVACFTVVAASFKDSINAVVDRTARADFIVTPKTVTQEAGVGAGVADRLRKDPAVGSVFELVAGSTNIGSDTSQVLGMDTSSVDTVIAASIQHGVPLSQVGDADVAVSEDMVTARHWQLGDTVPMQMQAPGVRRQRVVTVFARNPLLGDYIITLKTFRAANPKRLGDDAVLLIAAPGHPLSDVKTAVGKDVAGFPGLQVQDQAQFKKSQGDQVDQLLSILTALLVLAIIIALLGIVNTMALSIVERTRELGLVRALGMTRQQTRTMVRWETVIITLFGTLLGIAVGVGFGVALVKALGSQGVETLSVAPGQLASYVVLAFLAGLLAAVFPALRASRLNMLAAIATE